MIRLDHENAGQTSGRRFFFLEAKPDVRPRHFCLHSRSISVDHGCLCRAAAGEKEANMNGSWVFSLITLLYCVFHLVALTLALTFWRRHPKVCGLVLAGAILNLSA